MTKSIIKKAEIFLQASMHDKNIALIKWLSRATKNLGVADHSFIVGGAVRNFLINEPIKDIDITIDVVNSGKNSEWLAKELQKIIPAQTKLVTNQYGVAILTISGQWDLDGFPMKGETIEIANTRKESYDSSIGGKGYKPHMVEPANIHEDLIRREYGINTLLWRFLDLEDGPEKAPVIDLLNQGLQDIKDRKLRTPTDPDKTFTDDPTRILRAIKFFAKYGFELSDEVTASIKRNAHFLKDMPWNAVANILINDILKGVNPRKSLILMRELGIEAVIIEMLNGDIRGDQKSDSSGFKSTIENSLNTADHALLMDLMDAGWPIKTNLSFIGDTSVVRENISKMNPEQEKMYIAQLMKPKLNQMKIFEMFSLEGEKRSEVSRAARKLLIERPELAFSGLQEAAENYFTNA